MVNIPTVEDSLQRIAVVGMFDGVHHGHRFLIDYLKSEAEKRGLRSAVVTFNNHPLSIVAPQSMPRLLSTCNERISLLNSTDIDDCIMLEFDENLRQLSAHDFLTMLHNQYGITVLIVGFNNRFGRDCVDGIEQYRIIGNKLEMEIIQAPEFTLNGSHISSSIIRQQISEGKIIEANNELGYNYFIIGTVTEGKQLGRTIDFPTANIIPNDEHKLIPHSGVYAAFVTTPDGTRHKAMLNIGYRPTVDNTTTPQLSIEVHIIDFSGDVYGKTLTVEFLNYQREECRFNSIEGLRDQLFIDRQNVLNFISQYYS